MVLAEKLSRQSEGLQMTGGGGFARPADASGYKRLPVASNQCSFSVLATTRN